VADALRLGYSAIGFARRPHHQGEAADQRAVAARGEGRLREGQRRHLDDGGNIRSLRDGGANVSIIGRNTFQRPRADALDMPDMPDKIIAIYQGKM
jgi:hypothetical protein